MIEDLLVEVPAPTLRALQGLKFFPLSLTFSKAQWRFLLAALERPEGLWDEIVAAINEMLAGDPTERQHRDVRGTILLGCAPDITIRQRQAE